MKLQVIASETNKSAFIQRRAPPSITPPLSSHRRIITSWNRGAQLLFGYTAEEAVGQPVTLLIPVDRHDEEPFILGRIRRGESAG